MWRVLPILDVRRQHLSGAVVSNRIHDFDRSHHNMIRDYAMLPDKPFTLSSDDWHSTTSLVPSSLGVAPQRQAGSWDRNTSPLLLLSPQEANMGLCGCCGEPNADMRCGRCQGMYYCSAECQRKDWKIHKQGCKMCRHPPLNRQCPIVMHRHRWQSRPSPLETSTRSFVKWYLL